MNYKIDTVNSRKLIELENVTKIYQTNDGPVESLKPLSFHINEGEFVSVVGPSGCGKTFLTLDILIQHNLPYEYLEGNV
jgi:ABC-type lipoprotein export system ATPase subunit